MLTDLLTRIKNAGMARHNSLQAPFSKFDFEVAKVLQKEGFLKNVEKRSAGKKVFLDITLNYRGRNPAISGFRVTSKPSRRLYTGYRELKAVKHGYGVAILSTPEGILTDKDARNKKVGGEQIFQIW